IFGAAFAQEGHEALMFNDHHPTARGYALMARSVDETLQAAGLVPPESAATASSVPPPEPSVAPTLQALGEGRLQLVGPPGWAWHPAVARRPHAGESFPAGKLRVPLPADDVLAKARLEPAFSGRFAAEGRVQLSVPLWLRQQAAGAPLSACLVLLRDPA